MDEGTQTILGTVIADYKAGLQILEGMYEQQQLTRSEVESLEEAFAKQAADFLSRVFGYRFSSHDLANRQGLICTAYNELKKEYNSEEAIELIKIIFQA